MDIRESAFMGKITAGITHEMKNVLAIIKESAGLMEDLLSLTNESQFSHKEKFVRVLSNLGQQVARGVELSSRLNKFAHSSDSTSAQLDLNDIVQDVVFLSQRFARLKGVTVSAKPYEGPLMMVSYSLKLQMALFSCLMLIMDLSGSGTKIALRPELLGSGDLVVNFAVEGKDRPSDDWLTDPILSSRWEELEKMALALCAQIQLHQGPVWFTFALR
jgi:signal transduction histidine kinase